MIECRSGILSTVIVTLVALALIPSMTQAQQFTELDVGLPGMRGAAAAWGDYDGDGDLDIALSGNLGTASVADVFSRLYRNDGGAFIEVDAGLPNVGSGAFAWGDYDQDADVDLAMSGWMSDWNHTSKIYRNDGGVLVDTLANLTPVMGGGLDWGDYDNDGDLDLALVGAVGSDDYVSEVYRNDAGTFNNTGAGLVGVGGADVGWADYDHDGDLDLALGGEVTPPSTNLTTLYQNTAGLFSDAGSPFPQMEGCSLDWGDYDNDGWLDLVISGRTTTEFLTCIYHNENGVLTDVTPGTIAIDGQVSWADYDLDGDLDFALAGYTGSTGTDAISLIYRNDGGLFAPLDFGLVDVAYGAMDWGDYDNDGDLDLLLVGDTGTGNIARLYRNNQVTPVPAPGAFALVGIGMGTVGWLRKRRRL